MCLLGAVYLFVRSCIFVFVRSGIFVCLLGAVYLCVCREQCCCMTSRLGTPSLTWLAGWRVWRSMPPPPSESSSWGTK